MGIQNFELVVFNDDGTVKQKECYKSIRQMALKSGIPYHNLKVILDRANTPSKYKKSLVNQLMNKIQIIVHNPEINILQ